MRRRVFGPETEFSLSTLRAGRALLPDDPAAVTAGRFVFALAGRQEFLENGGRIYADQAHPEWAGPECVNPFDVVAYERAGVLLVAATVDLFADRDMPLRVLKNTTDGRQTWGAHESYQIPFHDSATMPLLHAFLVPFLLSRYVWAAPGGMMLVDGRWRFVLSQRASFMQSDVDSATTRMRPLVNTRNEALADGSARLHVISADANMMDWPTWMRFAATHLVLRVFEEARVSASHLYPQRVPAAVLTVGVPLSNWRYEARDGSLVRAVDVQRFYLRHAADLVASDGCEWERLAVSMWEGWLDALEADPMSLAGVLEWPTKLLFVERASAGAPDSVRGRFADMLWHDVCASPLFKLQAAGAVSQAVSGEAVSRALKQPPGDTRAFARGELVRLAAQRSLAVSMSWDWAKVTSVKAANMIEFRWPDPLNSYAAHLDVLRDELGDTRR